MKHSVYVFDIDGTVADCSHRRHFVQTKPANWDAFNSLVSLDPPVVPVVEIARLLYRSGYPLIFLSGREGTKKLHDDTVQWLYKTFGTFDFSLWMRTEGDNRSDEIVKLELMKAHIEPIYNVIGIFDDRPKVIRSWREHGYFVFDVNQTGAEF